MNAASNESAARARAEAAQFCQTYGRIRAEIQRVVVGQSAVIDAVLSALFAGGHVLLEGVPGLGKTLLVRTIGEAIELKFSRIQFTPDMMPADIQGTTVLVDVEGGGHELRFQQGPLVANLVLADEINRATPKTQSALLEAMQEKQITVSNRTIRLAEPYCVMATQNPIEQEGTYPLPEAQLDRFLFKVVVGYPEVDEYLEIIDRTTSNAVATAHVASNGPEILKLREVVRQVPVPEHVKRYAVELVVATQPGSRFAPPIVNQHVALGASPRAVQGLMLAGKVRALLAQRFAVAAEDVAGAAHAVLRHRVIVNFQGQAAGTRPDAIVDAVLAHVGAPRA
ncbi:MAG: AAA family ATPase [Planctomycetota bacterium]